GTGGTSSVYRIDWVGGPTCEKTDVGHRTAVIGGVDSGVPNVVSGNGCSVNQLIRDDQQWQNHGQFMQHIHEVTGYLLGIDVIDEPRQDAIATAAARSDIGRPGRRSRG